MNNWLEKGTILFVPLLISAYLKDHNAEYWWVGLLLIPLLLLEYYDNYKKKEAKK